MLSSPHSMNQVCKRHQLPHLVEFLVLRKQNRRIVPEALCFLKE